MISSFDVEFFEPVSFRGTFPWRGSTFPWRPGLYERMGPPKIDQDQCVATSKQAVWRTSYLQSLEDYRRLRYNHIISISYKSISIISIVMLWNNNSIQFYPTYWDYHNPSWEHTAVRQVLGITTMRLTPMVWSLEISWVMWARDETFTGCIRVKNNPSGYGETQQHDVTTSSHCTSQTDPVSRCLESIQWDFWRWRQHPRMMAASWRWGHSELRFVVCVGWSKHIQQGKPQSQLVDHG